MITKIKSCQSQKSTQLLNNNIIIPRGHIGYEMVDGQQGT